MMWEAVPHKAQSTSLNVLFDRVEGLLLGYLHLGVCPTRNLYDHVEDTIVLVSKERDVMPR